MAIIARPPCTAAAGVKMLEQIISRIEAGEEPDTISDVLAAFHIWHPRSVSDGRGVAGLRQQGVTTA